MAITPWKIELLGRMRVHRDGHVISKFRSQQARLLLAYLALYPSKIHPRDEVANLLWPGRDAAKRHAQLSVELSWLRAILEDGEQYGGVFKGTGSRAELGLNSNAVVTDVAEFRSAIGRAGQAANDVEKIAHLVRAVKLYRGDLLCGDEHTWVLDERGKLQKNHVGALHLLLDLLTEAREVIRAISCAELAVGMYQTSEEFHFVLIKLYSTAGRKSDAIRQYYALQEALRADGGRTPSDEVRQFAEQLANVERISVTAPTSKSTDVTPTSTQRAAIRGSLTPENSHAVAAQCLKLGEIECRNADYAKVQEYAEEALAFYRESKDRHGEAEALLLLGYALRTLGEGEPGRRCYEESIELFEQVGDAAGIARATEYMGYVYWANDDVSKTASCFKRSMGLHRELGNPAGIASAVDSLGNLASLQGRYVQAAAYFGKSMRLRQALKDRDGVSTCLLHLGRLAFHQGDYEKALERYNECMRIVEDLRKAGDVAHVLMLIGEVKWALGECAAARSNLEMSLVVGNDGSERRTAVPNAYLGLVAETEHDYVSALAFYTNSLNLFIKYQESYWQASVRLGLGRLLCKRGDLAGSQDCCQMSLPILFKRKDRKSIGEWLEVAAQIAMKKHDWGRTAVLLGAADYLRKKIGAPLPPTFAADIETTHAAAHGNFTDDDFTAALARGRRMTLKQAVDFALVKPRK